ncbi:TPA: hypothetical protein ACMDQL_000424 [Vibrio parahaemolyticus]|uniref:TniQ family protein n=1 Tax=Vibrio parahaemolyticus TaxID=670 RepID=UPI0003F5A429|nr:hypothetical protein [Vibrio parahaemolyticus]EHV9705070.1 hypothetical protein [Vibrio parahaemolyticus]
MAYLPVRFPPTSTHSWPGYLLTLARKNGLRDISRLCAILGVTVSLPRDMRNWSDELLAALIPKLAQALELEKHVFWDIAERHHDRMWSDLIPEIGDIRIAAPRICLSCCAENNGWFDWRWQLPVFSSCHVHRTELHNHYPNCHKPFKWRGEILTRCPNCGVTWSKLKQISIKPNLNEQKIWGSINHYKGKELPMLKDVVATMFALGRPYDTLKQRFQIWPLVEQQSQLTMNAYSLLSNPARVSEWKHACEKNRSDLTPFGNHAIYAPVTRWLEQCSSDNFVDDDDDDDDSVAPILVEYTEFIRKSRFNYLSDKDFSHPRYHVARSELAQLVKLHTHDLFPLVKSNLITPLNDTNSAIHQIFDARILLKLIPEFESNEDEAELVEVDRNTKALKDQLASYGDLLSSLVTGNVRGGVKSLQDWSIAVVHKSDYHTWLKKHFLTQCQNEQTLLETACILDISPRTTGLIRHHLRPFLHQND